MGELEYDHVKACVWEHFGKKLGYDNAAFRLDLTTKLCGPVVSNTIMLDNRKEIFARFVSNSEPSSNPRPCYDLTRDSIPFSAVSSRSSLPESLLPPSWASSSNSAQFNVRPSSSVYLTSLVAPPVNPPITSIVPNHVRTVPATTFVPKRDPEGNRAHSSYNSVPLSAFPILTPSAVKAAASVIQKDCQVEIGLVKRLLLTEDEWEWAPPFQIKFCQGKCISAGSFREAYDIRVIDYGELARGEYVIKIWNPNAISGRKYELSDVRIDSMDDLTKRSVQSQMVAKGLAQALATRVDARYGPTFKYISSYHLGWNGRIGSIEPKLPGKYVKYLNNMMNEVDYTEEIVMKAASLSHFSYEYTSGETLLSDVQGCGELLTDPEVASKERYNSKIQQLNYGFGNFGKASIVNFLQFHKCNRYCQLLKLNELSSVADWIFQQETEEAQRAKEAEQTE